MAAANGATNNYAGWFQGNVNVTGGTLTVNGSPVIVSDQMFKNDVEDIDNAMNIINNLQPRFYTLDTVNYPEFGFETDQQMGLIAQEVEQFLPSIVSNHVRPAQFDTLGIEILPEISYKGVEYEELIPLLIAGMKEQQVQISNLENENGTVTSYNDSLENVVSDLNDRLTNLENCLSNILQGLCNANQQAVSQTPEEIQEQLRSIIDVELSDKNSIVLNQNVPNPFAERTVISYSVPSSVQRAQIHFYDMNGVLINSVDITERGEGQINVYANDLSSGIYTYSLVADGKVVSTKKMMKN